MKIFHYTKLIKLNSIFTDGFLATEAKRSLNQVPHLTDFVWLTEKTSYPKTALPFLPMFTETHLTTHLQHKNIFVDLDKIGNLFGKFYRFSFDSTDSRLKKWVFSDERKALQSNVIWNMMEKKANKVGDDIRSFWFSTNDIQLEKFGLDVFENGYWINLLDNFSLSQIDSNNISIIDELKSKSIEKCDELGIPFQYQMAA